jgi:tetratricopeptide (TPR) repeat protein
MLETLYCDEHMFGFNPRPDPLGRALMAAQRAVEATPTSNLACQALAQALFFRREFASFRPLAERTIALNPMDGATVAFMGALIACSGDWDRGCAVTEDAMRLNPHFPGWYRLASVFNAYRQGDYRASVEGALRINIPGYFWTFVMSAAAFGQLGDLPAAEKAFENCFRRGRTLPPRLAKNSADGLTRNWSSTYSRVCAKQACPSEPEGQNDRAR